MMPRANGHCTGASASKASSDRLASAPISKSRLPSFSNADSAACSRKMSAAESKLERLAEAQALRDLAHDPPVGLRLAGSRQERALTRDAPFRIGDGAGFLAPGLRRQQHMRAGIDGVVGERRSPRPRTGRASPAPRARRRRRGSDTAGLVPITHSALISPRPIASNICDRLEALMRRAIRGAFQNRPTRSMSGGVKLHVRGELIGEPADLAAAHRIGLAGQRERRRAGLADPSGGEVAIDDGVDLVGALRRLVDALRDTA